MALKHNGVSGPRGPSLTTSADYVVSAADPRSTAVHEQMLKARSLHRTNSHGYSLQGVAESDTSTTTPQPPASAYSFFGGMISGAFSFRVAHLH